MEVASLSEAKDRKKYVLIGVVVGLLLLLAFLLLFKSPTQNIEGLTEEQQEEEKSYALQSSLSKQIAKDDGKEFNVSINDSNKYLDINFEHDLGLATSTLKPFVILKGGKKVFLEDELSKYNESITYEVVNLSPKQYKWSFNFTSPNNTEITHLGFAIATSLAPSLSNTVTDPNDDDYEVPDPYKIEIVGKQGTVIYDFNDIADHAQVNRTTKEVLIDLKGKTNLYLDPTISFMTSDLEDPHMTPMGPQKFAICWHDGTNNSIHYAVYDTNGSTILADTTIDSYTGTSGGRCKVSAFNESLIAVGWSERSTGSINTFYYQVWDDKGNNYTGIRTVCTKGHTSLEDNQIDVTALNSTTIIYCYSNYEDSTYDVSYDIYGLSTDRVATHNISTYTGATSRVSCSAFNSSFFVALYGDDNDDDLSYSVWDVKGNDLVSETDLDTIIGQPYFNDVDAIELSTDWGASKFAYTFYDGTADNTYGQIMYVNGSEVNSRAILDADLNLQRTSVGLLSKHGETNLALVYFNKGARDVEYFIWNGDGSEVLGRTDLDTQAESSKPGIVGKELATNLSICNNEDVWVVAWEEDNSVGGNWTTMTIGGGSWDGICDRKVDLDLIWPTASVNVTQNEFFNVTVNVTCGVDDCGTIDVSLDPWNERSKPYNFSDQNNIWALECEQETTTPPPSDGPIPTGCDGTLIDQTSNSDLDASDDQAITLIGDDATASKEWHLFYADVQENVNNISLLNWSWEGNSGGSNEAVYIYIWNHSASGWEQLAEVQQSTDEIVSSSKESSISDYVNSSGYTHFLVQRRYLNFGEIPETDFVKLEVTYDASEKGESDGLVSTNSSETPFYTNDTNPLVTSSLGEGQSELVTFWVNATGATDSTWDFFVFANRTARQTDSNVTASWYVTIESGAPPADTCTYGGSGNWRINCQDACVISTATDLGGANLTLNTDFSGTVIFRANVTNYDQLYIGNSCKLYTEYTFHPA